MSKSKKVQIIKAQNKRVQKIIEGHGDTFSVETEIKGTYLLVADDGWRGWVSPSEAKVENV